MDHHVGPVVGQGGDARYALSHCHTEDWRTCAKTHSCVPRTGNSDSSNGSNCIYDEMIDELTDGDGSNRTEYWKMILMKVCMVLYTVNHTSQH